MAIQRQYSLPNCKLILEGLGDSTDTRPLVAAVSTVECYFSGHEKPLMGGREFLESLVLAVSDYAQEFLSGIAHPAAHRQNQPKSVQLQRVEQNLHRLMVQPQAMDGAVVTPPQQLDLTTVQLFDLVEAIDQFYADAQTLPEMSLNLAPLPKRYVTSQEPLGKRVVAPALGASGLAIAAAALFFIPIPEVQRPEPTSNGTNRTESSESGGPASGASPSGSPSPTASPAASADEQTAAAVLDISPEITDPEEQEQLQSVLQTKLDEAWSAAGTTFSTDLEYRVGVAANGEVVGYRFINDAALQNRKEVPLINLLRVPTTAGATSASNPEPIAQFRVVFRADGALEVSPWYGESEPSPTPTESP